MRRLHLLCLLVFCSSLCYAQFTYGVKAGLNYGHVSGTVWNIFPDGSQSHHSQSASEAVVRPLVGAWVYMPVNEKWSLFYDLHLLQKNWNNQHFNFSAFLDYELYYFSLPIQVSYRIRRWDIQLGPELSYLVHTKEKLNVNNVQEKPLPLQLGIVLGMNYHFTHWFINLRASRDFTPFFSIDNHNSRLFLAEEFAAYHQGLQLTLGYHLPNIKRR